MADKLPNPNPIIRSALRKAWNISKTYIDFLTSRKLEFDWVKKDGTVATRKKVRWKCDNCQGLFSRSKADGKTKKGNPRLRPEIYVDHVDPVIDPKVGFTTWEEYWERLYCLDPDKLQILCKACHKEKTAEERELRVKHGTLKKGDPRS